MLNWTKDGDGGSGNPLGDPATAGKLLDELRDVEPLIALNDLRGWLDSLAKTPAPERNEQARAEVLARVQDAGEPHAAKLLAQFLSRSSAGQRGREASWIALVDYLKALTQAQVALGKPPAARVLNAVRMLAKAYLMRYYAVPRGVWKLAYAIHRRAEKDGSARTPVRVHANLTSSATQELLRLLMLSASAPELMAPDQIEVADRVIAQLGEDFTLRPPRVLDNVFCFDPAGDGPPMRTEERPPGLAADVRCFGAGAGHDALERIYRQLAAGRAADALAFGKDIAPYTQVSAIQHLLAFWGETCPYRPQPRAPEKGPLSVVHGFAAVWQQLSSSSASGLELSLVEDGEAAGQDPETWALCDAGGNEFGADAPKGGAEWARCGDLVCISAQDGVWWAGVIRSVRAEPGRGPHVVVYVLSRTARAVQLQARIEKGEEAVYTGEAARQFDFNRVRAIMVSDGAGGTQTPNMLVAPDGWKEDRIYELESEGGAARVLRGAHLMRQRDDYVRATFEWLDGSS